VGVRARIPEMPGIHGVPFLTNSSIMDIDFLPEHFIIVGGGYVGLEFAQIYRRLGGEVKIVEMGPRLIGREDEDVSQAVREILEAEGINTLEVANFPQKRDGNTSRAKQSPRETCSALEDSIPRQHEARVSSNCSASAGNGRRAPTLVIRDTNFCLVRSANTTASSCPAK
jgi:hypothetical protein